MGWLYPNSGPVRYPALVRFDDVVTLLRPRAFERLPGPDAHRILAPRPRAPWNLRSEAGAKPAAALALLYPAGEDTALLLTVRGRHLARHGGQISLPGGAIEPGETIEQAALRESAEEVGLDPGACVLHGRLSPLPIPVSGYVLHPVVATASPRPDLRPDAREVSRLIDAGIETLAASVGTETRVRDGVRFEVPYFELGTDKLWGATAMVVAELLSLLGRQARQRLP
jgi:8-oxo-dGTP pyrophosphatase MutT (NUDIX family)